MSEQQQPAFNIEKIYVSDLSLEIPNAPSIFLEREAPQVNLQLNTKNQTIDEGLYEVQVMVTVTAKVKDKVMFLVEVHQAGIFRIRNVPEKEIAPVLGIGCPNILFPYVRETVSDTVTRAGFPPVILNPVNFEAIYNQSQQRAGSESTETKQ
ncbi:MAG TPA: protein-export chaperone SecB [Nitrosomonas sp.]|uniref:protein-export chaperone SecB n=1 Tax=Nitrosomonas sp. TaxID=42353 RepID=UPI000E9E9DEA|nr:protein-export chaperone SecB [Nitrosomonas sp.]GJL74602.1 MAG: protein-export protein SecB [Nitrosomonas sp.]HBV21012.1 protein-export chaperone SecB [Nitrosomonas sp.]HNP26365.1 protein-export chaperone SecB [Nitrosomonas sp.]